MPETCGRAALACLPKVVLPIKAMQGTGSKTTEKERAEKFNMSDILVVIALVFHLFPFRTEKLSPTAPMVLRIAGE